MNDALARAADYVSHTDDGLLHWLRDAQDLLYATLAKLEPPTGS